MQEDIFTGTLEYRDIKFTFVFENYRLRLIPPEEKQNEVYYDWIMCKLNEGVYVPNNSVCVDEDILCGQCNEKNKNLVFLMNPKEDITYTHSFNTGKIVLFMNVVAWFWCDAGNGQSKISRMSFLCPEINQIHPVYQALDTFSAPADRGGVIELKTKDSATTTTEEHAFILEEKTVKIKFCIDKSISWAIGQPPIRLDAVLMFEFEPTDDYAFLLRLWLVAKTYLQYLNYRRNISFDSIRLFEKQLDEKYRYVSDLFVSMDACEREQLPLERKRFIKQALISEAESAILQDIADYRLYVEHIPDTFMSGQSINVARFVMITAGFEWEFGRFKPDGAKKSEDRIQAEELARVKLDTIIQESTSKTREILKSAKKGIGAHRLEVRITDACEELDDIVSVFGKRLYPLNQEEYNPEVIGKRLATQRNNFAHGAMEKEFNDSAILDIVFIQYVIYAMQLKHYGVSDINIQKALRDLFGCHVNLSEK